MSDHIIVTVTGPFRRERDSSTTEKEKNTCSKCGEKGHNCRNCPEAESNTSASGAKSSTSKKVRITDLRNARKVVTLQMPGHDEGAGSDTEKEESDEDDDDGEAVPADSDDDDDDDDEGQSVGPNTWYKMYSQTTTGGSTNVDENPV